MIQTGENHEQKPDQRRGRNPVFALEMIQTGHPNPKGENHEQKVAIQYSPWRWFRPPVRTFRPQGQPQSQSSIRPGDDSDLE